MNNEPTKLHEFCDRLQTQKKKKMCGLLFILNFLVFCLLHCLVAVRHRHYHVIVVFFFSISVEWRSRRRSKETGGNRCQRLAKRATCFEACQRRKGQAKRGASFYGLLLWVCWTLYEYQCGTSLHMSSILLRFVSSSRQTHHRYSLSYRYTSMATGSTFDLKIAHQVCM